MTTRSILGSIVQMATIQVTEGAADAFAVAELQTGISTASRFGWMIEKVEFYFSTSIVAQPQGADCDATLQLIQGTQPAALVGFDDADLICQARVIAPGLAASANAYIIPEISVWTPPENFMLVDPSLFLAIDSTATAVALVGTCRIFYFPVELGELDILRLIALR